MLTPQLDKAGPSFAKFTGKFAKWAASAGGQSTIKEMGRAFTAWLDLVKQIARIIGSVAGAGAGPGTNQIGKWADKMQGFADTLSKPADKKSLGGFFQRSLDDVDKLWPVLKQVATDLTGIYKVWKPLGSIVQTVVKAVPAWVVAVGSVAYVGAKGVVGAFKGAKGVFGLFSGKRDGSSTQAVRRNRFGGGGGGRAEAGVRRAARRRRRQAGSSGLTKLVKSGCELLERFPKLRPAGGRRKGLAGVGTAIALSAADSRRPAGPESGVGGHKGMDRKASQVSGKRRQPVRRAERQECQAARPGGIQSDPRLPPGSLSPAQVGLLRHSDRPRPIQGANWRPCPKSFVADVAGSSATRPARPSANVHGADQPSRSRSSTRTRTSR